MTPRGRWRALGLAAAFLVSGFLVAAGLYGLAAALFWGEARPPQAAAMLLQTGATLTAFGAATWVFGFRLAGLEPVDLRWVPGGRRHLSAGIAIGAAPALAAMVAAVPLADARWGFDGGAPAEWVVTALGLGLVLLPAAFAEELIFRGVPLVVLGEAFGRGTAIVGVAGAFALAHLLNPGITPLAVGNIALAGVMLGLAFYLPGGLWTATGVHLGWNLTLAVLAAPVSGLPFEVPWLDYRAGSPVWLSGGDFGPEGGLLATAVLGGAAILVARRVSSASAR